MPLNKAPSLAISSTGTVGNRSEVQDWLLQQATRSTFGKDTFGKEERETLERGRSPETKTAAKRAQRISSAVEGQVSRVKESREAFVKSTGEDKGNARTTLQEDVNLLKRLKTGTKTAPTRVPKSPTSTLPESQEVLFEEREPLERLKQGRDPFGEHTWGTES